jgi:hypothetical protein
MHKPLANAFTCISEGYRVSQTWRTNYLVPYRGCLNVHEKNMEKMFPTKKNLLFLLLLLTIIQCKQ